MIYGFYMGAIGTPNLRDHAYQASTTYASLKANAVDFINSVRGTYIWSSLWSSISGQENSKVHVSQFYQTVSERFPDFQNDLIDHLKDYARPGSFKEKLQYATLVDPDISDWHIADLYNGRYRIAGLAGFSNAHPPTRPRHLQELILEVARRSIKNSKVTIEEVKSGERSKGGTK